MLEHKKIQNLSDYFKDLNGRSEKGVYFYRINGYSSEVNEFIKKYYEAARESGVIIEGKIPNPDEKNLEYYNEIMGMDFQMHVQFIGKSLKKWLPRMNDIQRKNVADSIYDTLLKLQQNGKTENICKNAYIKFMCWLYYKFERITNQLGENKLPKILIEGSVSSYELMILEILSKAGSDIVFLQYNGDQEYLKIDPLSATSDLYFENGLSAFPEGFCIKNVREEIQNQINIQRLYGEPPKAVNCTNAWVTGHGLEDVKTNILARGNDNSFYYNCFYRIVGVEDKMTYANELFQLYQELNNSGRKVVVVNGEIDKPTNEEITGIKRSNYQKFDQLVLELANNIQYAQSPDLKNIIKKAFIDTLVEENKTEKNINKLTNKAVYLLCWLKRFQNQLFGIWKYPEVGCFILFGGCRTENDALFIKFLSKLPIDILVLCPNLNTACMLEDAKLLELKYANSLNMEQFPQSNNHLQIGTVAFRAERELDEIMYQDSGMYREKQHSEANTISLQTMYEEISIIWDEEVRFRPNFSTSQDVVNIPVIFAKVCGVKDGKMDDYWINIKKLIKVEDCVFISKAPFLLHSDPNPVKAYATEYYKNRKLQKNVIKNSPGYQYGFLREEIQDYMLEKLLILIEDKLIKGTFENGTEYTIISTVLNLPKDIIRKIQKIDFTKKIPKLVYLNTTEDMVSLEDAIMVAYLNLIGFDIVYFAPTGYQSLEKFYNKKIMEEHQIGEYMYDLTVPNFDSIKNNEKKVSRLRNLFKKK